MDTGAKTLKFLSSIAELLHSSMGHSSPVGCGVERINQSIPFKHFEYLQNRGLVLSLLSPGLCRFAMLQQTMSFRHGKVRQWITHSISYPYDEGCIPIDLDGKVCCE